MPPPPTSLSAKQIQIASGHSAHLLSLPLRISQNSRAIRDQRSRVRVSHECTTVFGMIKGTSWEEKDRMKERDREKEKERERCVCGSVNGYSGIHY